MTSQEQVLSDDTSNMLAEFARNTLQDNSKTLVVSSVVACWFRAGKRMEQRQHQHPASGSGCDPDPRANTRQRAV